VSDADLDALEGFYRALGEPVTVHLSPYADPSLTTALGRRDYHLTDFEQVLVRGVERGSRRAAEAGRIRVERVARDEAASWSRMVAEGFGGAEALTDAGIAVGVTLFHAPDVTCFRAFVDGAPAGGAAVQCVSALGVAYLFAASTLPAHRQRGVQAALLEARLSHAGESGCDLATVSTVPGTASQRNVERHGFRVAYTRVIVVRAAA
jgi:GNAT superfamily N-acetyltransferase